MTDCDEWNTETRDECTNMGVSRTNRIKMANVRHVTSGTERTKFQAA